MHTPISRQLETLRESLVVSIARWTADASQLSTAIPDLRLYRRQQPSGLMGCMGEASVAFVVQGTKRTVLGDGAFVHDNRRFLMSSLGLPVIMQIVEATADRPYLGFTMKLDPRVMADLVAKGSLAPPQEPTTCCGMDLGEATPALLDAFSRLIALLDEPDNIAALAPLIQREIHYRLLLSREGAQLWQIVSAGSPSHRIARAVDWLRSHYTEPLRIGELAALAQMSSSSFHHNFRQLTAMSPLQFQKWLRLTEARRLMLMERMDAAVAGFQVGYESPSQFSREYSRLFGAPPLRDVTRMRQVAVSNDERAGA